MEWAEIMHAAVEQARLSRRRRRSLRVSRLFALLSVLFLILGAGSVAWPFAVQARTDARLDAQASRAAATALGFPYSDRSRMISQAVDYNEALAASGQPVLGEAEDPFSGGASGDFTGSDDREYTNLLDFGDGVMGRVLIPSISVDLPIRHGASQDVLDEGAGHLHGTSLPVGGEGTHAVVTAHSNMSKASFFTRLDELRQGDAFYLQVAGKTLAYRVSDVTTVLPQGASGDFDVLRIRPGRDLVTLLTCTGAGNSRRLLVTGGRNRMPDQVPAPEDAPGDTKRGLRDGIAAAACVAAAAGAPIRMLHARRFETAPRHGRGGRRRGRRLRRGGAHGRGRA